MRCPAGKLSDIDFAALRAEYCEPYEQKGTSFPIEIREVLPRVENIEAETLGDAIDKAMDMYKKSEVVLDADDFRDVSYLPAGAESRRPLKNILFFNIEFLIYAKIHQL